MSKIDICNRALSLLTTKRISSLDVSGREENLCNVFLDSSKEELMRMYPFNFTLRTRQFTPVTTIEKNGWEYVYQYPSDCLNLMMVTESGKNSYVTNEYYFEDDLVLDDGKNFDVKNAFEDNKKYVFTDIKDAYFTYVFNINDYTLFDPLFANALVLYLAHHLSTALTGKIDLAEHYYSRFLVAFERAKGVNATEGNKLKFNFDRYINAR